MIRMALNYGRPTTVRILSVVLASVLGAMLAAPAPARAQTIDPAFEKDIRYMLELTGAQKIGEQMMDIVMQQMSQSMQRTNPNVPPRVVEITREVTKEIFVREFPSLMPKMVVAYAKVLTHDEVRQLIAFYETPLGRRMIEVTPLLAQAGAVAGQEWAQQLVPQLQSQLEQRFRAEHLIP